jgi:hypothetical protein
MMAHSEVGFTNPGEDFKPLVDRVLRRKQLALPLNFTSCPLSVDLEEGAMKVPNSIQVAKALPSNAL